MLKKELTTGNKHWGRWRYDPAKPASLILNGEYEIVLDRIKNEANLGHWLIHLSEKNWVTVDDLGNLVRAISDLNENGIHTIARFIDLSLN